LTRESWITRKTHDEPIHDSCNQMLFKLDVSVKRYLPLTLNQTVKV